ncbi:MAG: SUF system Fe-S cluster assembly protein [Bradymonadia bacterium]
MSNLLKDMIDQATQAADEMAEGASKVRQAAEDAETAPVTPEPQVDDVHGWPPEAAAEVVAQAQAQSEEGLRERIVDALKTIYDPEIPVNIYDLGLIYEVNLDEDRNVEVIMTLTSPHCPVAESMPAEVEARTRLVPGTSDVKVELTWEPPWNPDSMTDEAKLELGMF